MSWVFCSDPEEESTPSMTEDEILAEFQETIKAIELLPDGGNLSGEENQEEDAAKSLGKTTGRNEEIGIGAANLTGNTRSIVSRGVEAELGTDAMNTDNNQISGNHFLFL
jgi:hypothetical protein